MYENKSRLVLPSSFCLVAVVTSLVAGICFFPDVAHCSSRSISRNRRNELNSLNLFTTDISKNLWLPSDDDKPIETIIWSPLSVYSTLIPLFEGAAGKTLDELTELLHISNEGDAFTVLERASANSVLKSFTGLFVANNYDLDPSYLERLTKSKKNGGSGTTTEIESSDFSQSPLKVADRINSVISTSTGGYIRDIIQPGSITQDTKIIIVNGVQFKGKWANQFDPTLTKTEIFHGLKGPSNVEMMGQKSTFEFGDFQSLGFKILQLRYEETELALQIILPIDGTDLSTVMNTLNQPGKIDEVSKHLELTELNILVPKFRLESDVPVEQALTNAGLSTLFTPKANLSRMTQKNGDGDKTAEDLYVSAMIHRTVFELDEQGTKAAAATAGFLIPLSGFVTQELEKFTVDKPFVIVLRDDSSGSILFYGCVTNLDDDEKATLTRENILVRPYKIDGAGVSKSNTNDQWWIHTGTPEYLVEPTPPQQPPKATKSQNDLQYSIGTENGPTPRFQQPEPTHPTGIRFPFPSADVLKNYVQLTHSLNKTKSQQLQE